MVIRALTIALVLGCLTTDKSIGWRAASRKLVVVFGDAQLHLLRQVARPGGERQQAELRPADRRLTPVA